ncbi:TPA: type II toxin-antitoxin system HicA family toxin [Neisseria lactamica]|uniref:type II toxin-antitoxin system HicA family toxin n=1 Tax=Neisseria basseii TaxID=2830650 RepID=UPI00265955C4|nr:type II toxin-antitoxin system HicA family toxin [Neisseria basseii]
MQSRELIALIEADGWKLVRTKGSHHQFKKEGVPWLITVSHPEKQVSRHQVADARRKSGLKF